MLTTKTLQQIFYKIANQTLKQATKEAISMMPKNPRDDGHGKQANSLDNNEASKAINNTIGICDAIKQNE